jgi:hypothetical protein
VTRAVESFGPSALNVVFSDPLTQGEVQAFATYVETLRAALVR